MQLINCGCGNKYVINKDWINIDFNSNTENVQSINIIQGLPFKNDSVDAVFSSCMLEHFTKDQAADYLKESHRILKKGGIIRIVVPDLENVCREYLRILELVRKDSAYEKQYEYIVIELLDQMTRKTFGGEMQKYWDSPDKDEEYIKLRTGYPAAAPLQPVKKSIRYTIRRCLSGVKRLLGRFKFWQVYRMGKFIYAGEVHQWMYDSYSLSRELEKAGFHNVRVMKCNESDIAHWSEYGLEVNEDGSEYTPNTLYIEAVK